MHPRSVLLAYNVSPDKFGGMEAFAQELAWQLKAKGWTLTIWFKDEAPPLTRAKLLAPGNVTLDVVKDQLSLAPLANLRVFSKLLRLRPDVMVYSIGGVVRWWPWLARLAGVRRILYWDQTSRARNAMDYTASAKVRWIVKPLSLVVCASQFVKACTDREGIVPASRSQIIYSGTDCVRPRGNGASFRHSLGIPDSRLVVLQVSWLVPDKGIDVALRAAQIVLAARPEVHFLFCGDGKFRAQYQRLAVELGIDSNVTWTGQVEDLCGVGAFRAADMQIQCSQWQEAFCFAVAEGMTVGLPIIAARIGGLPELVTEDVNGTLFDPPSYEQLAAAILRLAADEQLRERMGKASRERALARFDLRERVADWVKLLTTN